MPPKEPAYNIDWIWSFDSNVHVANNREWFTTFTPFESKISSTHNDLTHLVEGVGDVELEVRKIVGDTKRATGPKNSKIVLRDVLLVPSFVCNVMGNPVREDYDVSIGAERWLCDNKTGKGLGMLDKNPLGMTKVLLKGQAKGTTGLPKDMDYKLNTVWAEEEKKKWMEEKKKT
ncbi:hypothetical protein CLAFUW4_00001 [Fulvia fulva]|uniref:uncharacterized protein n=1 Tax=Passalora fulva TaxID=5499 RepID=UPI0028529CF1|nr:uncharacterized protein CLAFUR5_20394 [Fulvia fulva]KAK4635405.1 hypothetical protein CLAFUR4_00001 [Fulvia fulva]KAK4638026.1 hypothetical protein CLAFUR0_00001 [Fulvia fulva]WMI38739.1 hypothetical protein CLAFUR5_20394 [Fulvia fulva]WPV09658.1 hypothetical protein CLAFUW4_00001 [Fulvia fulva]WPV23578.1 hypothetical protein CLAFUW7_00001 [Fulvia fulva]